MIFHGLKPALGKGFGRMGDALFLVSCLPRGKRDADRWFGEERREGWEGVWVIECVRDKHGEREGRWCGFG